MKWPRILDSARG